jgi:hydrogenase maturation protease
MRRIVCIGNRYVAEDAAGPRVFDALKARPLPEGVQVVDGGLAGLDLLRHADGAERLIFVDASVGLGAPGSVAELDPDALARGASRSLGHAAGLPYLLRALPLASDQAPPAVRVVGVESPFDAEAIERAAALALRLATEQEGRA